MAKAKSGESKMGLIIALAFFVITSIALGVFAYQFHSEIEGAKNEVTKAKEVEKKATELYIAEQKRNVVYRSFLGDKISDNEKKLVENVPAGDPLREEQKALLTRARAILKAAFPNPGKGDPDPSTFLAWDWPAGGALPDSPRDQPGLGGKTTNVLQEAVKFIAAAETTRRQSVQAIQDANVEKDKAAKAAGDYEKGKADLEAARAATVQEKATVTASLAAEQAKIAKTYDDKTTEQRNQLRAITTAKNDAEREKTVTADALATTQSLLAEQRKKDEAKKAALPYDQPKGKIVSRQGNVVEINLGRADLLQTGVVFTVQPLDYQDKGEQSRIRQIFDSKGRPMRDREGNAVKMFQPKGTIEIVEILGPNLAKGQITSEYDDNRERIMAEDLIYNASWNKGVGDHVVLVGLFDKDGNGTDDIKQVARELKKAGVTVDGYFDLSSNQWAEGGPTDRTAYVIRGEFPILIAASLGEGLTTEKQKLRTALSAAITSAEEKGAKTISYRDYFPRVGYSVAYGVPDDAINQASSKYLQALPPPAAPPSDK